MSHPERWKMQISSVASRIMRRATVTDWQWWQLPRALRWYVACPPVAAVAAVSFEASRTEWHLLDLAKFLLLMCCGMISVASTPRMMYRTGGVTRDFTTIWVLPAAILLPPVYAAIIPLPLLVVMQLYVHRGILHRTVFTVASISLSYSAASVVFRLFSASIAGENVGSGTHAFTWSVAVAACYILGSRIQHFLVVGAVKISAPKVRIWRMERNREALQGLFVEIDLGVLITLAVALSPMMVVIALPTVLLVRRFLVHPELVAQSRADAKTGLLNVSAWEREAEAELSRATRLRTPLALALVDIDHFKMVNDTYGHLVGDRVLKAIADALRGQLRDYDKAGRFGGEEFVLLLAHATESEACRIAERLRTYVGGMEIPINDSPGAPCVCITISIGVTAMGAGRNRDLTDMLAAADAALYRAKQTGRNRVCAADRDQRMELEVEIDDTRAEIVEADAAGASLALAKSL